MNDSCLADELITGYLQEFQEGVTWNFFNDPYRYISGDSWVSFENWQTTAKHCLENSVNVVQALEILLLTDRVKYLSKAEMVLKEWEKNGCHDAYQYYEILSHFPLDFKLRDEYLGPAEYEAFLEDDGWGYNKNARDALFRLAESDFLQIVGEWLDSRILSGPRDEEIAEKYFPLLVEMGENCNHYLSSESIQSVKDFVFRYLARDEKQFFSLLNDNEIYRESRSLWIVDSVAFSTWRLGWFEVLSYLSNSEWYWASLFDDDWQDDNRNLLVWSLLKRNSTIVRRAELLIKEGNIDGAIAWKRLNSSENTILRFDS